MMQYPRLIEAIDRLPLPEAPHNLYEPIRYFLNIGGKRVRPVLLLKACEAMGGTVEQAMGPAIAVELFHNFTLLHDDIMDEAPLRRNQPTVHAKYNTSIAILSGDALMIKAYEYLIQTRTECLPELLVLFNKTALEVCEGQQLDLDYAAKPSVTTAEYLEMIRLKTSVLLAAALQMGALVAGADDHNQSKFYQFGMHTGIAFQIQDDILDVFGNPEQFGKKAGGDILTNKNTFLKLKALELASAKQLEALHFWYGSDHRDREAEKVEKVTALFEQLGVRQMAEEQMELHLKRAFHALDEIRNAKADDLEQLRAFAHYLIQRQH